MLLELLDLGQVHLTEEVRRRCSLCFSTRPPALTVRLGPRPRSRAGSCPALQVAVTSGRSEWRWSLTPSRALGFPHNEQEIREIHDQHNKQSKRANLLQSSSDMIRPVPKHTLSLWRFIADVFLSLVAFCNLSSSRIHSTLHSTATALENIFYKNAGNIQCQQEMFTLN